MSKLAVEELLLEDWKVLLNFREENLVEIFIQFLNNLVDKYLMELVELLFNILLLKVVDTPLKEAVPKELSKIMLFLLKLIKVANNWLKLRLSVEVVQLKKLYKILPILALLLLIK
jgi:hypothetical protein